MKCPNCTTEMTSMTLDAHLTAPVAVDVCTACQAFWFDKYESLQLSPRSTLTLMKFIGEHSSPAKTPVADPLRCPRCLCRLEVTHDFQRNTRFGYWRCEEHGRFIRFFDFLKEKNFIRVLSPQQVEQLRENVQTVNCSNCGAAIDLMTSSSCAHCGSPISILDMKQSQELLSQLQRAAQPQPIDPALPLELARAKRQVEHLFGPADSNPSWLDGLDNVSASGLVEAGLTAVARWLSESGF